MSTTQRKALSTCPPNILFFAGADPSGGAGATADITTAAAWGCHPCTIITAITAQNTQRCTDIYALPHTLVHAQVREVIAEFPPAVIKLSMLGDIANAELFAQLSVQCPSVPILCDPIISTTTGKTIMTTETQRVLLEDIFPFCTLITPNLQEAQCLTGCSNTSDAAHHLLCTGTRAVLMTGDHDGQDLCHHLYVRDPISRNNRYARLRCPQLAGDFHGAGCTLAAAIAARLALGDALTEAINTAQRFCFQALSYAYHHGYAQAIPYRLQRHYDPN